MEAGFISFVPSEGNKDALASLFGSSCAISIYSLRLQHRGEDREDRWRLVTPACNNWQSEATTSSPQQNGKGLNPGRNLHRQAGRNRQKSQSTQKQVRHRRQHSEERETIWKRRRAGRGFNTQVNRWGKKTKGELNQHDKNTNFKSAIKYRSWRDKLAYYSHVCVCSSLKGILLVTCTGCIPASHR